MANELLTAEEQRVTLIGIDTTIIKEYPISLPMLLKAQSHKTASQIIEVVSDYYNPEVNFLAKYPDFKESNNRPFSVRLDLVDYLTKRFGVEK